MPDEDDKAEDDGLTPEEQAEDKEQKKKAFPGKKITKEKEEEIVAKLGEGATTKNLAEEYGVSERSIQRIAKDHNLTRKTEKQAPSQPTSSTELIMPGSLDGSMRMAATREIIRENVVDFEQAIRTGKLCFDKFRKHAEEHGLTLNDYMELAVVFYENHRFEVEQLRSDLQTALDYIEDLEVEVRPYAKEEQRRKDLKELVFVDALMGQKDPELRKAYLSL